MFGRATVLDMINRSSENEADRRRFLRGAGVAGMGVVGTAMLGGIGVSAANADDGDAAAISDAAILNFALNLEYLEGEFYSFAFTGHGLPANVTDGKGQRGPVTGGHQVPFKTPEIRSRAREIYGDESTHVSFLRAALGSAKVARPAIDLKQSFTTAAQAAGLIGPGQTFDPFADENSFLLGAFIFEDVGVTAYKGAAPLISNKTYLGAAAGILAVEAYHAGIIRSALYSRGLDKEAGKISDLRDALDGPSDLDQGIVKDGWANLVPTDANGLAFSRTPGQVLNIAYGTPKKATSGLFFPNGVNGSLNTSAANG